MSIRANFLVAGLILCAGLAHGQTAEPHNGYWWLQLPYPMKVAWVEGFGDGSDVVGSFVTWACGKQASAGLTTPAQYEWADKVCNNPAVKLFMHPNVTYGQVVEGLDHFYADYRNKNIDVSSAIPWVYGELRGAPQSFLDEYMRMMREQTVNR